MARVKPKRIQSKPFKKPAFYCDEDFPAPSLRLLSKFKTKPSVLDFGFQGRDDIFHFQYALEHKSVLLTLDEDYLDNKKFRLNNSYGVIVIKVGELASWERVNEVLSRSLPFLKLQTDSSIRNVKYVFSLEGYMKIYFKSVGIVKEEYKWR